MTSGGALTLERGLGLLDLVAHGVDRLDDLAVRSGLSRSAVHRMLTSFVRLQYLTLGADNRYRLGVKLLDLGARAEQTLNLPAEVNAVLTRLSEETSDACHLGIRIEHEVLYLAKARGRRGMEMASHPGYRFRAQHTAMGKALLAHEPPAVVESVFDPSDPPTGRSITSLEEFRRVLGDVRALGYALDDQENEPGLVCVAVAVPDVRGEVAAAISISAPSVYMTAERIAALQEPLARARRDVGALLTPGFAGRWL